MHGKRNICVAIIIAFDCVFSDACLGTGSVANPQYGGSGHVVCIEVLSLKGTKHREEFNTAVGKEWMGLGGVPHLAKQFEHIPDIYAYIEKVRG